MSGPEKPRELKFGCRKFATRQNLWVLVGLTFFGLGIHASAARDPDGFVQMFKDFRSNYKSDVESSEIAKRFSYVFVPGFLNEFSHNYFGDNIRFLEKADVDSDSIVMVHPNSSKSVSENVPKVLEAIHKVHKKSNGRPVIVFGHSKGSVEVLATLAKFPDLLRRSVAHAFLIQGAYKGSKVADLIREHGSVGDLSFGLRTQAGLSWRLLRSLGYLSSAGFLNLTTRGSESSWVGWTQVPVSVRKLLAKHVTFITSYRACKHHSRFIRPYGCWLERRNVRSDGLVAFADQSIPGLGTRIELADMDHADLVVPYPVSNQSKKVRRALIKTCLRYLSQP